MEEYSDPRNPQVFVIDDVVGVFGLQKSKLDVSTDYEQTITKPCMVKSRTLMTCRETVFNETLPYKPFLGRKKNMIRFIVQIMHSMTMTKYKFSRSMV
jgi:hypothetical protein